MAVSSLFLQAVRKFVFHSLTYFLIVLLHFIQEKIGGNKKMHILVGIGIIAILAFCAWQGYKRGIIGGVIAILFIIVSLYGANLVASTYSDDFTTVFRPFISGYLDSVEVSVANELVPSHMQGLSTEDMFRIDASLEETLANSVFEALGVHPSRTERLAERFLSYRAAGDISFNRAMTDVMVYAICFLIVYVIAFTLILIVLTVLYNIVHLTFRLPGDRRIDQYGGAVLGLVQGILLVLALTWALGYIGLALPEFAERSAVLNFFIRNNFLVNHINL